MKVVVLVKQVPLVTDLKFDPETKTLIREGVPNVINPYDRYAIVESVKLKKAHGGEAVAVTMGPPQAREAMVEALALGCDRAVHIVDRAFAGSDTLATARTLSLFLKKEGYDLIFCGKYSVDAETGQVGPEVAELLDIPQITGITKLEVAEGGRHIKATRVTDEGQEVIECDLPALLTAEERLNRPGPTPPAALEAARSRPVEVLSATDLAEDTVMALQQTAVAAFQALELRDYGRVDMRLQPDGRVQVIEVNPNPWLGSRAEFAMAARKAGRTYTQLVGEIADLAAARS